MEGQRDPGKTWGVGDCVRHPGEAGVRLGKQESLRDLFSVLPTCRPRRGISSRG